MHWCCCWVRDTPLIPDMGLTTIIHYNYYDFWKHLILDKISFYLQREAVMNYFVLFLDLTKHLILDYINFHLQIIYFQRKAILHNFGDFCQILIGWIIKSSVQTFQPLIVIYRRVNLVFCHWTEQQLNGHCLIPSDPGLSTIFVKHMKNTFILYFL